MVNNAFIVKVTLLKGGEMYLCVEWQNYNKKAQRGIALFQKSWKAWRALSQVLRSHLIMSPIPGWRPAATDLQKMAEEINHNFGLHSGENGLGKMMGVLVVKNMEGVWDTWRPTLEDSTMAINIMVMCHPYLTYWMKKDFTGRKKKAISAINREVIRLENEVSYLEVRGYAKTEEEAAVFGCIKRN